MTTQKSEIPLPLKGFKVPVKKDEKGREIVIEGMGDNRFRVHVKKGR
jgi:hypothetical protein